MQSSTLTPMVRRFSGLKAAYIVALVVADVLLLRLAFDLAYDLRVWLDPRAAERMAPLSQFDQLAWLYAAVMVGTFAVRRLYIPSRGVSRVDQLYAVAGAVAVGWVVSLAASLLVTRTIEPPRLMLLYWPVLAIALVWLGRMGIDAILREARRRGRDRERILIVGAGREASLVDAKIREAPELGYELVGFVAQDGAVGGAAQVNGSVLGGLSDVPALVRAHDVGEVIIAAPGIGHRELVDLVNACTQEHVNIKIYPDIFELMAREVETSELTGLPLMRVRDVALRGWGRLLKRAMDVVGSWVLLVLLSPLMLLAALLVKLTSPEGRVLYVQERVGLDGQPFQLLKLRSMRPDAEAETGPVWTVPGDARRTPLGTFLRRFSIDEWPQLVNVLVGEMSLVGPRPERPEFVAQFEQEVPRYQERHREKAGLTGWAQVNGLRGLGSVEERTKYDLFYVENWSLAFDLKILLKTVGTVFRDRHAY